jgi:subtilisin family serine protease
MKKHICVVTSIIFSLAVSSSCFDVSNVMNADNMIFDDEQISIFSSKGNPYNGINNQQDGRDVKIINPIDKVEISDDLLLENSNETIEIDSNDPYVDSQWALTDTNSYLVWDKIKDVQKETVYVAVLDTGVDYDHVDLENRVDEKMGYDFVNDDDDAMDDNGHGTHVSGIIAAEMDNDEGVVGIVGDLDVVIIPIKVLDSDGSGNEGDIVEGIEYAIEQGADIINISFGGVISDADDLKGAIEDALAEDILVVAASGNNSESCDMYIPASIEGVYTVAASDSDDTISSFSNYGESLDISAPGEEIISTVLNDSYEAWNGTSMAAPIVSGIAAMFKAYDNDLSSEEIITLLNSSATDIMQSGEDILSGYGLINAASAYEILTGEDIYEEVTDSSETTESEIPQDQMPQYQMPPLEMEQYEMPIFNNNNPIQNRRILQRN